MIVSKLHVDSVCHSYGNNRILRDVFLSCKTGEIKGLLGRNGSGKSTLLKIIFGTEKPISKYVSVNDKLIKNVADGRNLINYLPQDNFLPNNLKIETLINLFLTEENRNIVLSNYHVEPLLNKKNQQLSGGEKRIIEILLLIHSQAKFLLLDEPFNGLSPIMKEYVIEYIKKMTLEKGFLITDHDYRNIINLSDNIIFLQDGFVRQIEDIKELVKFGYLTDFNFDSL